MNKRFIPLIAVTAALGIITQLAAHREEIRVFKTVKKNEPWCVQIRDENQNLISQTTILDSTDRYTSSDRIDKRLFIDLSKGENIVHVYHDNKVCQRDYNPEDSGRMFSITEATYKSGDQLKITADDIELIAKPLDKPQPSSKSSGMKVRAYKMTGRKSKWCAQVIDPGTGEVLSESKFAKNTDGLTTKSLKLQLGGNYAANQIIVHKSSTCSTTKGEPIKSDMITELPKPGEQIEIGSDSVSITNSPREPKDIETRKVEARKTDKTTHGDKWLIQTFTDANDPDSELSSTSIKKDTSGFTTNGLEIAVGMPTYVRVTGKGINPEPSTINPNDTGNYLLINKYGEARLGDKNDAGDIELSQFLKE